MHDKEKQIVMTTDDVDKIYVLVTETSFGGDVQRAVLLNPKTPMRVLEWLYKNASGYDVKTLIARHPNASDEMLKKILGESITSNGESGEFYYPSWAAFNALLTLLRRKGVLDEGTSPIPSDPAPLNHESKDKLTEMIQGDLCAKSGVDATEKSILKAIAVALNKPIHPGGKNMRMEVGFSTGQSTLSNRVCKLALSNYPMPLIPLEVYQLGELREFYAIKSGIKAIPDEISKLENLRVLVLDGNEIKEIPSTLGRLIGLKELSLRENQLASLPASLNQLTSIEILRLSGNPGLYISDELHSWIQGLKAHKCKVEI